MSRADIIDRYFKKKEGVREMTAKICLHPDTTLNCHTCAMEEELAAAIEQRDAAVLDAERYRWLRDNRLTGGFRGLLFAQAMGWKPENMGAKQVDTAIDAAIRAMKKEEK